MEYRFLLDWKGNWNPTWEPANVFKGLVEKVLMKCLEKIFFSASQKNRVIKEVDFKFISNEPKKSFFLNVFKKLD